MAYCTKSDLLLAFGEAELAQLTDREHAAVVDDALLGSAIASAEAEINVWLEGRYALPLASVPRILTQIACDVVRYQLAGDIGADHPAAVRYAARQKLLRAIAEGRAALGPDSAGSAAVPVDTVQVTPGRSDFADRSAW